MSKLYLDHQKVKHDGDKPRLNAYQQAVFNAMKSGRLMSLSEIQNKICCTTGKAYMTTGISARFRDFRTHPLCLYYSAESKHMRDNLWLYRLTINEE